jgi:hypothetical protein
MAEKCKTCNDKFWTQPRRLCVDRGANDCDEFQFTFFCFFMLIIGSIRCIYDF